MFLSFPLFISSLLSSRLSPLSHPRLLVHLLLIFFQTSFPPSSALSSPLLPCHSFPSFPLPFSYAPLFLSVVSHLISSLALSPSSLPNFLNASPLLCSFFVCLLSSFALSSFSLFYPFALHLSPLFSFLISYFPSLLLLFYFLLLCCPYCLPFLRSPISDPLLSSFSLLPPLTSLPLLSSFLFSSSHPLNPSFISSLFLFSPTSCNPPLLYLLPPLHFCPLSVLLSSPLYSNFSSALLPFLISSFLYCMFLSFLIFSPLDSSLCFLLSSALFPAITEGDGLSICVISAD